MMQPRWLLTLVLLAQTAPALRYDERYVDHNLNMNQDTANPLDYYTLYDNHTYFPSPANWRFPFYSFFIDRFVNGDPTNDNALVCSLALLSGCGSLTIWQ